MPFKDLKEGTTHYYGDNCGEPAHNSMYKTNEEVIALLEEEKLADQSLDAHSQDCLCTRCTKYVNKDAIKSFIFSLRSSDREALLEASLACAPEPFIGKLSEKMIGYMDCRSEFKSNLTRLKEMK